MRYTVFMLLVAFFLNGCIQKEISVSIPIVEDNEMKKQMSVASGDILNFEFESNPTTGYEWFVEYNSDILNLLESKYIESGEKKLVGMPGRQRFKFRAIKKGETTIEFSYKRPWETGKPPVKKIICNVMVK